MMHMITSFNDTRQNHRPSASQESVVLRYGNSMQILQKSLHVNISHGQKIICFSFSLFITFPAGYKTHVDIIFRYRQSGIGKLIYWNIRGTDIVTKKDVPRRDLTHDLKSARLHRQINIRLSNFIKNSVFKTYISSSYFQLSNFFLYKLRNQFLIIGVLFKPSNAVNME